MNALRGVLADTTPLKTPAYRRLWLANIITVIGAQLSIVAVPQQVFQITLSSAYVGLTGVFALVPLIVFGLWGGALADVMDRRTLLMCTTFGLIGTSALFWLQAFLNLNNVWVVLVLLAVQQAFFAVNQPTRSALLPRILPPGQLPAANSLNMTVMNFGAIAGPLSAGILIYYIGLETLYLIDTVFLFATLWAVIKLPAIPPSTAGQRAGLRSVFDGFAYLATQKVLLASFVVDIIAMVFGMPRALFPQIAHESFGDPASGGPVLGMLFAAMSAGAVVGGVFSGWLPRVKRQGMAVIVAITVWGAAMIGFGVAVGLASDGATTVALWFALAFLALGGGADMISAAFRSTMLQTVATDEMRGRLQGVFIVVVAGGPRIGDVLHGAAAASVGTAAAAAGGGVLVVIGVSLAALALPAFIRYRVGSVARGMTE
ncbi:MFS transporter [Rhodococcus sp. 14-2470-1b]|uniref:MFS transporter n=1 Tax=unclassified Rhodococcus (in: high G+C Gram-positive bacteria) TaxID=192944 RepID=UPI000B9A571D|nr:MFS transporter [Rhodococcus sp. 14-2470-1b]OZF56383.1 MFS transporter [Rhodococcus sp. 14-2470-1b]